TPYREGTGLTPIGSTIPTAQYAFVRKYLTNGTLQDTGNNASDFIFVATDAGTYGPSSVKATLGGPNPESTSSFVEVAYSALPDSLVEPLNAQTASPNRVNVLTAPKASLEFRRRFTNNTGATIYGLRFKVVRLTTLNAPVFYASQSDLRPVGSSDVSLS